MIGVADFLSQIWLEKGIFKIQHDLYSCHRVVFRHLDPV